MLKPMRQTAMTTSVAVAMIALAPLAGLAKEPVGAPVPDVARPAAWAPVVTIPGVPNLHRVTDTYYRSAQPEADGFKAIAKDPGIKTVVSLRAFHNDQSLLVGTGITLIRVPIFTWHIETEDVVRALAAIRQSEAKGPVLLHCQHGADRTGLITALYRVLYQGWTKDAALDEMEHGEFGYHAIWGNIPRYLKNADVEALKTKVAAAMRVPVK
jgi:protein tyrosine/serine phosphatase